MSKSVRGRLQTKSKTFLDSLENPNPDSDSFEESTIALFLDGIKFWYDDPDAAVDVCFVHGLTSDCESTWTADGQSAPWPKTLLPSELEDARVLTYDYDAYVVRNGVAASTRLVDYAANLLSGLTSDRARCGASSRPPVFVAHSLGGLVCKKAILLSRNNPEPRLRSIIDHTKGVIFMSTPHRGSWLAYWANLSASALGLIKSANKSLLTTLQRDD
jgi:pimeloyl-ACP methyl ester carboxylesterase